MAFRFGLLMKLGDDGPQRAVERAVARAERGDLSVAVLKQSAGESWSAAKFSMADGGVHSLQINCGDDVVEQFIGLAREAGVMEEGSAMESMAVWTVSGTMDMPAVNELTAAIVGASPFVPWDESAGFNRHN